MSFFIQLFFLLSVEWGLAQEEVRADHATGEARFVSEHETGLPKPLECPRFLRLFSPEVEANLSRAHQLAGANRPVRFTPLSEVLSNPTYKEAVQRAFNRLAERDLKAAKIPENINPPVPPKKPEPKSATQSDREAYQKELQTYIERMQDFRNRQGEYRELEASAEKFRELLAEEIGGEVPFVILDTPAFQWKVKDKDGKEISLPSHLLRAFNKDHHGPLLRYDRADPGNNAKRNTTKQLLDEIEILVRRVGPKDAVKALNEILKDPTTDNLGDGALSIWIANNLSTIVQNPNLRKLLGQATFYEDFGMFGTRWKEIEQTAKDPTQLRAARELSEALFNGYDRLLREFRTANPGSPGVNESDRFNMLPEKAQRELMSRALEHIDRVVQNPEYRSEQANQFQKAVEVARPMVQAQHETLKKDLVQSFVREGTGEKQAGELVETFSRDVFAFYSADPNAPGVGRFSTWAANNMRTSGIGTILEITPKGPEKTGFISAHPHGRPIMIRFSGAAENLKALNLQKGGTSFDVGGRPGPSDFYFSFSGIRSDPLTVTKEFVREWQKAKSH